MIARLWREPLVHFLLIGLLLFLLYATIGGSSSGRSITVDERVIAELVGRFEGTWQRPPTAEEFRGLIESHVRDEIFYREGVALGLDRDDAQVKRRVRQMVELIAEESGAEKPVTESELRAWLTTHPARYAEPAILTFQQVMIDPARHLPSLDATLKHIRSALAAGTDPATLGDSHMLPARVESMPLDFVARDFGENFATALSTMKVGAWEGPVRSGLGVHFVRLERRVPGRSATLDEVRPAVARDLEADRRARSADAYYRDLRRGYDVVIKAGSAPARP